MLEITSEIIFIFTRELETLSIDNENSYPMNRIVFSKNCENFNRIISIDTKPSAKFQSESMLQSVNQTQIRD